MKIQLLNRDEYFKHVIAGDHESFGLYKGLDTEIEKLAEGKVEFVISTGAVDRARDIVVPDGGDFKNWRKNPVVLFAHNSHQPPVGRGSGIHVKDGKIRAKAEFTPADLYPFGNMIGRMVSDGFLKATSIGFIPTEMKLAEDQEERKYGLDFLKWELLEFSVVPVPANPEALIGAHAAGIDTGPLREWCEQVLDGENLPKGLSRDTVERAWKILESKKFFEIEIPDKKEEKKEEPTSAIVNPELYVLRSEVSSLIAQAVDERLKHHGILLEQEKVKLNFDLDDLKTGKDSTIQINATEEEVRVAIREAITE